MVADSRIPVGVIGAGNMGANHVRVYDELPGAELVEVVEPDSDTAAEIRENYDVDVLDTVEDISQARAVTVAVPNDLHRPVVEQCAELGLDVLVEKPLADNLDDAKAIVDIADQNDLVLQVGHIERFNSAVETLEQLLETQSIISVEAHRLGPFNEHLTDENVVFDLMIHDIDVVSSLIDASIDDINAVGVNVQSSTADYANAQFKYSDGTVATLTASHVTHGKVRTLDVTTKEAFIRLDYQKQDIVVQRMGSAETTRLTNQSGYRTETITESPYIKNREPLQAELDHFLVAVRNRTEPKVGGSNGVTAVHNAAIVDSQLL